MARFVYAPGYYCNIGNHVFKTTKFQLVHDRLVAEGLVAEEDFLVPEPATRSDLDLVHTRGYIEDLFGYVHTRQTMTSEMPISREIVDAFVLGAGGTMLAARTALEEHTPTMNLAGGFHHAFPSWAEGFCYVNDVALGARRVMRDGLAARAAVIDCDLHQSNGTAVIFQNDPGVFTFSIHQERNYPVKQKSDLDIGLEDEVGDEVYLAELKRAVVKILDRHRPEFVMYVAGADPFEGDQLGRIRLTKPGLKQRDEIVIGECAARGIPVTATLAGGYAWDVNDTVEIHVNTARTLIDCTSAYER